MNKQIEFAVSFVATGVLTYIFGYWYLLACLIAFGYWEDFNVAAAWPLNLGKEIRRYLNGKL